MESALTPREIQARIRGGESLAEVAEAAGVPVEQIDVYAGPVLAEREHAASLARESQVRRRGESSSPRLLGEVVTEALERVGVEVEQIQWDAWRDENRRWTVSVTWPTEGADQRGLFDFDMRGRASTAANDAARDLISEATPVVESPTDPDSEPTIDLNDELAIVRAVQADTEPPAVVPDQPSARIIRLPGEHTGEREPDDYSPAELEQFDGVYDIIPNPRGDMDVLYDMLAGFNEDSVRIYAGLTQPVHAPSEAEQPEADQSEPEQPRPEHPEPQTTGQPEPTASPEPEPAPKPRPRPQTRTQSTARSTQRPKVQQRQKSAPAARPVQQQPQAEPGQPQPEPTPEAHQPAQQATPRPRPASPAGTRPATAPPAQQPATPPSEAEASEQDTLLGDPAPKPAPRPAKRRKRASVPTWDEIMFGGPQPPEQQ